MDSKLHVLFLATEWGSSQGGFSTINRELAKQFAGSPKVSRVSFLVPPGQDSKVKEEAESFGIHLVEAEDRTGVDAAQLLSFLPKSLDRIDVVIGHGSKLGPQAQRIKASHQCLWVQFVHESCEEMGMYTGIKEGEKQHKIEIDLCEKADLVVAIGPKLANIYTASLRYNNKTVTELVPGLFKEFAKLTPAENDTGDFRILVFGNTDLNDFELKGYDIAAQAVGSMRPEKYDLIFVGAPEGKQEEVKEMLLKKGIKRNQLKVRSFCKSRGDLSKMFCEADLCIMPCRTAGFGLTALEAMSAGVPILVAPNSGFGQALKEVTHGNSCIVDSDEPEVWREKIECVLEKERPQRLKEAAEIRDAYNAKYSWTEECTKLVENICRVKVGISCFIVVIIFYFRHKQEGNGEGKGKGEGAKSVCAFIAGAHISKSYCLLHVYYWQAN